MLTDMLRVHCPACRAAYQVGADKVGKTVRCRKCAQSWTVADPAPAPAPAPVSAKPAAPVKKTVAKPRARTRAPAVVEKAPAKFSRKHLIVAAAAVFVVVAGIGAWALSGPGPSKTPAAPVAENPPAAKRPVPAKAAAAVPVAAPATKPTSAIAETAPAGKPVAAVAVTPPAAKPQPPVQPLVAPAPAPAPAPKAAKKPGGSPLALEASELFKTPKVLEISLEIAPGDYEALKREPRAYVRATLQEGGKTWKNVAVHLKGAAGSFRGVDDKAGFTINMDKHVDDQHFHGLDKFHLNNSVQDPSFVSELICGEIFHAAGVPASRCAHAILTVNGKSKGFYVLKEGYDRAFLERNFGSKKGNLYDGGFLRDLDQPLQLISDKDDVKPYTELKSLMNAAALADPAQRFKELERLLDADRWVSYLVLEALTFDWDGYPMNRNNYRIYHDPKRDKIVFIPSGIDQMFADPNGNLLPNFNGAVARAYVTTPEGRQRYLNRMDEILKSVWKPADWSKRLDEVEAVIKPALAKVDAGHSQQLPAHIGRLKAAFQQRQQTAGTNLRRLLNPTPPKKIAGGLSLLDDGFLRKYLFLGPISVQEAPGAAGLAKDWLGGEAGLKPAAGSKVKTASGELVWKAYEAPDGMTDLHAASGKQAEVSVGYWAAYLVCEKDFKDLKLRMGSDDQGKVWINGKEVLKYEGDRAASPDQDNADNIALNKGVNRVLFKVVNGGGPSGGILRFTLADGTPFMDAKPSLSPDGK